MLLLLLVRVRFFCSCVPCTFLWLHVAPFRAFFLSFFHPSSPFTPFHFSVAMVVLLCLLRHVCTGIPFVPNVYGMRR